MQVQVYGLDGGRYIFNQISELVIDSHGTGSTDITVVAPHGRGLRVFRENTLAIQMDTDDTVFSLDGGKSG